MRVSCSLTCWHPSEVVVSMSLFTASLRACLKQSKPISLQTPSLQIFNSLPKPRIQSFSVISKMSLPVQVELTAPNGLKYTQPAGLFINNEFVKAKNGATLETVYPADESVITSVYAADKEDIDLAVQAARAAYENPNWSSIDPYERSRLMSKLADLVERDRHILGTIDAWDNGKPYTVAANEDVEEVIRLLRYYAGWADKLYGKTIDVGPQKLAYTLHQPVGVCGQIIPWNYPLLMAGWKLGPALATGNTIVLKTAEQTPLSALYLGNLIKEAGFPAGVVNIVSGYGNTAGAALASHEDVDKIAFTGSTLTGSIIMKAAAVNLKNITLETGGKSPNIVFADADLDQAVKWSHFGIMGNMGQVCSATSRIYVESSIYEDFIARFKEATKTLSVVDHPFSETCYQGPQVTQQQFDKIRQYIETGKSEGARLVAGGERIGGKGFFIEPTIFADVKDAMTISKEEIFGPVVAISSFETEQEVVKRANSSTYGLAASVFTENLKKAHRVASKIQAGMVWINSSNDSHYAIPFGGVKQSGIGRELGDYALQAYTQVKAVHVNLGNDL